MASELHHHPASLIIMFHTQRLVTVLFEALICWSYADAIANFCRAFKIRFAIPPYISASPMEKISPRNLDNFYQASTSLKLFSRAELNDEKNRSLIEKLYVDPLPNEQVFKTLMASSTTLLIGRKGTGKSTVFQRVQHEIRKGKSNIISAYMDIRNVFESSQVDQVTSDRLDLLENALTAEQVQKFLLYKRFAKTLISEITQELRSQIERSYLSRIRERMLGTSDEVFQGLNNLAARLDNPDYENIEGFVRVGNKSSGKLETKSTAGLAGGLSASAQNASAKLSGSVSVEEAASDSKEHDYSQLLMRVIGINDVIDELKAVLAAVDIKYLYVFLDDFSELPEDAMHVLVDSLISPLSRWSEFIKFKIAAYPSRVYLGTLDKTKVEELYLDIYGLYGASGVTKMEEKATDFVQRVIERRLNHYCKIAPYEYLDMRSPEIWRTIFYASAANPRIIGHIMLYAYESNLLYGNKIGVRAIQEAAQRYYEEKVAPYFLSGVYRNSFRERSSVYSLKELLEKIVNRARNIRQEDRTRETHRSRTFSSHFYVMQEYEDLLTSLELAFFVTKYFEQSDRTGARVSIYALNYGLCTKYQIGFGRPSERREDRLYFVDRAFDYNAIIRSYINENQEIKCDSCGELFDMQMLPALKMLSMRCPKCQAGSCQVVNLSKRYGDVLSAVVPELLLPEAELGILHTLHSENKVMFAAEIAGELDCSGQLVGRRARNLAERNLVERKQQGQLYKYKITDDAEAAYFSDRSAFDLNIDEH